MIERAEAQTSPTSPWQGASHHEPASQPPPTSTVDPPWRRLEPGADDDVTKPFNPRELMVRVKNLLWRITAEATQPESRDNSVHRFEC